MSHSERKVTIPLIIENEDFLPVYATHGAAGADVKAAIKEPLILQPGASCAVPTGIKASIPEGYEIQLRPRSGLALKHQITVLNTPGTVDADYRGEIMVILINHGPKEFVITPGLRIAQMVVSPVTQATFVPATELSTTIRGAGGFGHTGSH